MKILTLNTHSLIEDDYENKCRIFTEGIAKLMPDVIALQEVNQTIGKNTVPNTDHAFSVGSVPIKEDNHALKTAYMLSRMGIKYHLAWAGIKKGFGMYDEGIAIMSLIPIENAVCFTISSINDYENWKTRKALIARVGKTDICTSHFGWWDDAEEPFEPQFLKLNSELEKRGCGILAGDFNAPDTACGEAYELVIKNGWQDAYKSADIRQGYETVSGPIAGWNKNDKIRIDYIFTKDNVPVKKCETVFDGTNFMRVSDHFGVMADTERSAK